MELSAVHRDLLKEFPETEKIFCDEIGNITFLANDGKDYFMVNTDKTGYDSMVGFFENRAEYYTEIEGFEKDKTWKEIKI